MKSRRVKIIVATVIGGIVGMACGGIATASAADHHKPTTHTAAAQLQRLHDQLEAALSGKDVSKVRTSVDKLRPILGQLKSAPLERAAQAQTYKADTLAARAQRNLLPGLPDPLALVTDLLTTLLSTIMDLVSGLLGGLPVPLPPLGDLPLPLPLPLPGAPSDDAPAPEEPGGLPLPLPLPGGEQPPADTPQAPDAPGAPGAPAEPLLPGLPLPLP
ncbi:MAG TPA: hypothetical protein VGX25_24180 [Actinophytocola sp.]|uniref:hypothetical protein n=1 Tax=Actinophytocola sp. TaxID=1872138 RepID=UPI002DDD2086|nr:hypothetical protein [Actinophytocola sp.]HEV2782503.1 hypothetical protein [Actinophytocola sp.]